MTSYDNNNIFAKILRGELPCEKIYEDENTFVLLDIHPRANGHCLVLPKSPARNILDINPEALEAVSRTTQHIAKALMSAFDADGISVIQSNERAGNQEVFHLHVHVIPRHEGEPMQRPSSQMEDIKNLQITGKKIRNALNEA